MAIVTSRASSYFLLSLAETIVIPDTSVVISSIFAMMVVRRFAIPLICMMERNGSRGRLRFFPRRAALVVILRDEVQKLRLSTRPSVSVNSCISRTFLSTRSPSTGSSRALDWCSRRAKGLDDSTSSGSSERMPARTNETTTDSREKLDFLR